MDWKEQYRKREEFEKNSTVVSEDVFVDFNTEAADETETVSRLVEGQLAVDVRKRVKAPADAPVFLVEVAQDYWLSDVTAERDYRMTVKCNGVEKKFNFYSAHENFKRLLNWLDADPDTPIGGEED
jgi:hypothetical protein